MEDKPATADPAANKAADAAVEADVEWNRQQMNRRRFLSAGQRTGGSRAEDQRRGRAASRSGSQDSSVSGTGSR